MNLYMSLVGRRRTLRNVASWATWCLLRRNGTMWGCSVTFFRYLFLLVPVVADSDPISACRLCTAGIFGRSTTDPSQCASHNQKNVQCLEEGIRETAVQCFQACTWSSYSQARWVLPENGWVWCLYHCHGYVFFLSFGSPFNILLNGDFSTWSKEEVWTFREELGCWSSSWCQGVGSKEGVHFDHDVSIEI